MGEIVDKINRDVLERFKGHYGDKSCPICPKPVTGLTFSTAPSQTTLGVFCLPALVEAVPAGFRPAQDQFLVVVPLKCDGCGNVRLLDATANVKDAIQRQGAW